MALIYLLYFYIICIFYNLSILIFSLLLSALTATRRMRFFDLILSEFRELNSFKYLYNQKLKLLLSVMFKLNKKKPD